MILEIELADKTVTLRLRHWDAYVPARTCGDPYDCYPAEGGVGDYDVLEVLVGEGDQAPIDSLTIQDDEKIQKTLFKIMEDGQPDYYDED
jgi:hypothetical protein